MGLLGLVQLRAMDRAEFNEAVVEYLRENGYEEAAEFTRKNASNSRALGPTEVAEEDGLPLEEDSVPAVAEQVVEDVRP